MNVSTPGIHSLGGLICIHVSGASGGSVEVILDGDNRSLRLVFPLSNGKVDSCFRLPSDFRGDIDIDILDGAGNRGMTGSFQIP